MSKEVYRRTGANEQKKKSSWKRLYYLAYTGLFILLCGLVYGYFIRSGKSFVYSDDGWKQHFKALTYYAEWMRTILSNLWNHHKLMMPQFSFSIGYGADIVTTLHYYAIGDPLNLFAVFVPSEYMAYFYSFLVLVRLYLAGIAFSAYCFYRKNYGRISVLAGAFSYIFCGFALAAAVKHPYFVNPMIYFPLLLLGAEKIWKEKKPWIFIGSVFISAVSSFYFFYMLVLMVILYVLIRVFVPYKRGNIKQAFGKIFQIGGYGLLGVMLSAFLLFPVILLFLNNPRTKYSSTYRVFYSQRYYERFLAGFVDCGSIGHWNFMGYTALALLAVLLLFLCRKKYTELKVAFIVLTMLLLLPYAGFLLNGFSYVSNRWIWAYSMLISYILTAMWEEMQQLSRKKQAVLGTVTILYFLLGFVLKPGDMVRGLKLTLLIMIPVFCVLVLFRHVKKRNGRIALELGLLSLVVANIAGTSYFAYAPTRSSYLTEFLDMDKVYSKLNTSETKVMKAVDDNGGFFRYSGDIYNAANANCTLISGFSSVQFYWSLCNSTMAPFMEQLCLRDNSAYNYKTLDNRTALNTLASVKYYITKEPDAADANYVPYGFQPYQIKDSLENKYDVYKNEYALPLGYTYESCISESDYENMTPVERQESLLQGILLKDIPEGYNRTEPVLTSRSMDYTVACGSNAVTMQGNSFVVTEKDAQVTLSFDGERNSETCLYLKGLAYEGISPLSLYSDDTSVDPLNLYTEEKWNALSEAEQKKEERAEKYWSEPIETVIPVTSVNEDGKTTLKRLSYRTPRYTWYAGRHDFIINMCYDKMAKKAITITFPERGIYSFDEMKIICQPMENYADQVSALRACVLENIDLHNDNGAHATNEVTGSISLDKAKILCLTVPYSSGWKAYVDGEEQEILQANTIFMALPLSAGNHDIRLVYRMPGMNTGIMISCAGILCLCLVILYRRKFKKLDLEETRK